MKDYFEISTKSLFDLTVIKISNKALKKYEI